MTYLSDSIPSKFPKLFFSLSLIFYTVHRNLSDSMRYIIWPPTQVWNFLFLMGQLVTVNPNFSALFTILCLYIHVIPCICTVNVFLTLLHVSKSQFVFFSASILIVLIYWMAQASSNVVTQKLIRNVIVWNELSWNGVLQILQVLAPYLEF